MKDETDAWVEALSGRATGDAPEAAREALMLREALLRLRSTSEAPSAPADAGREAALLERARREGLFPSHAPAARRLRVGRVPVWPAFGAVTAVAAAVLVAVIVLRPAREVEVVRGVSSGLVTLEAPDPPVLKSQLLEELRAAGVQANGYQRLGVAGIDADLPQPVPARVREVLARHHIALPPDGVLRIEIAPARNP
jgi:hypothetical protein